MQKTLDKKVIISFYYYDYCCPCCCCCYSHCHSCCMALGATYFSPLVESLSMRNTKVHFPFISLSFSITHAHSVSHSLFPSYSSQWIYACAQPIAIVSGLCLKSLWTPVWMLLHAYKFISCIWCKTHISPRIKTLICIWAYTHEHSTSNCSSSMHAFTYRESLFELLIIKNESESYLRWTKYHCGFQQTSYRRSVNICAPFDYLCFCIWSALYYSSNLYVPLSNWIKTLKTRKT